MIEWGGKLKSGVRLPVLLEQVEKAFCSLLLPNRGEGN